MMNIREYFNNYFENNGFDAWYEEVNDLLNLYEEVMNDDDNDGSALDEWAEARGVDLSIVNDESNETYFTEWLWDYLED